MPSGVGCLINLQILPFFVVGPDRGGRIQELECLNELFDELIITNLELVRDEEEAKKANLQSKTKLDELQLVWSGERDYDKDSNYNDKKVLEGYRLCGEISRVGHLPLLKKLEIIGLEDVRYMGDEFYGSDEASTNGKVKIFPALKIFSVYSMKSLVEWKAPPTFNAFPCLEELIVSQCPKLKSIPTSHLSSIVEFAVELCDAIDELIFDESHPLASLRSLRIESCGNLVSFQSAEGLSSLLDLTIVSCHKLTALPRQLKSCSSLSDLCIFNCDQLLSVPEDLRELHSLVNLSVIDCPNVTNFTWDVLKCLTQLKGLGINCCYEAFNSILHIPFLQTVFIVGPCPFESLLHQPQGLTPIKELGIVQFDGMEALPEWLGKLSSIESIAIGKCLNLRYLPSATAIQGLPLLKELDIRDCPLLKESCAKGTGSEWSKISHIPKISIDEVILQDLGTSIWHDRCIAMA